MLATAAPSIQDPAHAFADLRVAPEAALGALRATGTEPSGTLAAAYLLAATDMLLAGALAQAFGPDDDFDGALGLLASRRSPQPLPVLQAQHAIVLALAQLPPVVVDVGPEAQASAADRLQRLADALQLEIALAQQSLAEASA